MHSTNGGSSYTGGSSGGGGGSSGGGGNGVGGGDDITISAFICVPVSMIEDSEKLNLPSVTTVTCAREVLRQDLDLVRVVAGLLLLVAATDPLPLHFFLAWWQWAHTTSGSWLTL
jgi:hypothetical protein